MITTQTINDFLEGSPYSEQERQEITLYLTGLQDSELKEVAN
jgi:hypothetical protein